MGTNLAVRDNDRMTAAEVKSNVNLIQEVIKEVMKPGVHFGKIPGTTKNTLFKAGSEVILVTFRISVEPVVTDLSIPGIFRYRVEARGISASGQYLGSGIGEASSDEEKYAWRQATCNEEWAAAPETSRRLKWKRGDKGGYSTQQVRTNPADAANTVLKMAKKRAQIDMTLTVTAASDCFQQDIEDMPEEMQAEIAGHEHAPKPPVPQVARRSEQAPPQAAAGNSITDKQAKRFYAIYKGAGWSDEEVKSYLKATYGIEHSRDIPMAQYDEIVAFFQVPRKQEAPAPTAAPFPKGEHLDF